jgi:hypothetical protein
MAGMASILLCTWRQSPLRSAMRVLHCAWSIDSGAPLARFQ